MNTLSLTFEAVAPIHRPSAADFNQAKIKGYYRKIIATLTGRSNRLQDLKTITRNANIRNHRYSGTHTVRIDQIKGSEGRTQDFDQDFNPLKSHNRDRWVNIARAW